MTCAPFDPQPRPPRFDIPAGACDCHAHVFTPVSALDAARTYTPAPAPLDAYQSMLNTLRMDRAVIVQPSVYGTDNRATLAAVSAHPRTFRAIVVLAGDESKGDLQKLHDRGARGARINALASQTVPRDDLIRLGHRLADLGWHMQMLVDVSQFDDLEGFLRALPVPVIFDHMGHVPVGMGVETPGFQTLLRLMGDGKAWAKLSGSYRVTTQRLPPYDDVAPFARALVAANPERCVWGSDWPHPHIPVAMPNDGALLDMLTDWVPDRATRNQILVANPARLYGFDN